MSDDRQAGCAPASADAAARARDVALLILDVDGVMTDGRLYLDDAGHEMKAFHSQDGHALKMLAATGVRVAIITGRRSRLVELRARELGITLLFQGARDKKVALAALCAKTGLEPGRMAHMGDDIPDLSLFGRVRLAIMPGDGNPVMAVHAHYITRSGGGRGAVREACEMLMRAQGTWDAALEAWR